MAFSPLLVKLVRMDNLKEITCAITDHSLNNVLDMEERRTLALYIESMM